MKINKKMYNVLNKKDSNKIREIKNRENKVKGRNVLLFI